MDFPFPQLDLSYTNNLVQNIQREQEKNPEMIQEAAEERNRKFDEARSRRYVKFLLYSLANPPFSHMRRCVVYGCIYTEKGRLYFEIPLPL